MAIPFVALVATQIFQFALQKALNPVKTPTYGGSAINLLDTAQPAPIVYGTVRLGGVVFYQEVPPISADNPTQVYLHRLVAVAGHEINAFTKFYLDDEELTLDGSGFVTSPARFNDGKTLRLISHLGADDQAADETLQLESGGLWTYEHRAYGIAYFYVRAYFDPDKFPNGPPQITALIQGRKVYDPRDGSTAFSSNPALCLRDYLILSRIADESELDESSFIAAANICDEDVALAAGGTEKRYSCDGYFPTDQKPADIINSIVASMGGSLSYSQGKWFCKAGAYTEPVLALDEDDLRGPIRVVTRASRQQLFNRVTGIFRGPDSNWQEDNYPPVISDTFLNQDNQQISEVELNLPFTSSPSRAQRLAKIALYRQREQLVVSGTFGLSALQLTPGDTVSLTNARFGWSAKTFEVTEWAFGLADGGDLLVNMTLQEISAAVYDWDADEAAFESNNTTLLSPETVPTVGITTSEVQRVSNEQIVNVLVATVTATADQAANIDRVEVQYRDGTETQYRAMGTGELTISGAVAAGRFEAINVDVSSYDVRARAINGVGVRGEWTTVAGIVGGDGSPPDGVTGFAGSVNGGTVHLGWIAVADPKLSHYVIRHSVLESAATFSDATTAAQKISRPGTSISLPARAGTYTIKAFSKLGTASSAYASFVLPSDDLQTYATNLSQTEHSTFSGTKTDCSVSSGFLVITDPSVAPSTATYEFSTYIDTGAARRVHSYIYIRTTRSAPSGASLWDGIAGNWDTWAGDWDDWTSGLQVADTNVTAYIATTPDDPAGSPTWSAWREFQAGDFYGRAFKFRVELISTDDGVTPAIDELVAHVGY